MQELKQKRSLFCCRSIIFGAMKKALLAFLFTVLFTYAQAQEMWGISNSNYAGNMGVALNPSSIAGAPYKYDINLLAFDIFVQNNFAYIPARYGLLRSLIYGSSDGPELIMDNFSNTRKSLFFHSNVLGPSFVWSEDKTYSWAFHTALRAEVGLLKVPYGLNNFGIETNYGGQHTFEIPAFSTAVMNWAEVGITFGKVTKNETKKYVKWGGTLNYIMPFNGAYTDFRGVDYSTTDSTLMVQKVDATFAHSTVNTAGGDYMMVRGWGLSTTIGVTIVKGRSPRAYSLKKAANDLQKYRSRLGFSLIDLGFARFNNADARVMNLRGGSYWSGNNLDGIQFGSFDRFDTALINKVGGSVGNKPFNILMPTALSVQFDYALAAHWYVNVTALNRIHFMPNQLARGNQDVLSLRYESRKFEMAFNLNLFEYSSFSSGVALRYRWFVIGTDRLSQLASVTDFNAANIFFGYKVNFTSNPARTKRVVSCPAYKSH